jgi:hypothetical protein
MTIHTLWIKCQEMVNIPQKIVEKLGGNKAKKLNSKNIYYSVVSAWPAGQWPFNTSSENSSKSKTNTTTGKTVLKLVKS